MGAFGRAPGRVNLIGEHIDYNGGMVLPAALSLGLEVSLTPRAEDRARIEAEGYETVVRSLSEQASCDWSDPALGALREARSLGMLDSGADLAISSTIPAGSGLSSSAALIVAILKAARDHAGGGPGDVELAVAARRVENEYMGVPCGIMDQMAVALATPGSAMALDTATLEYTLVDLPAAHDLVVIHSGVTRMLTDGRYAERKVECDVAKAHFGTDDLCHLTLEQVEAAPLPADVMRRARHCVTEHARVLTAVGALQTGDVALLGRQMVESHASMRDDFAITLPAIDDLVESAMDLGAVGARLTGGGFGGCIVACVASDGRQSWQDSLLASHSQARFIDAIAGAPR